MMASTELLTAIVIPALLITVCSPVVLIILLIRDWKKRTLW